MQNSKQITRYIREADESFTVTPFNTSDVVISVDDLRKMQQEIIKLIDVSLFNLKSSLVRQPKTQSGIFNTLKRWWSNIWYGPKNKKENPYYYHNLFGSLGGSVNESTIDLPLEHFKILHEHSVKLQEAVMSDVGKTRLMSIIDLWAKELKSALETLVQNCISGKGCSLKQIGKSPVETKGPVATGPLPEPDPTTVPKITPRTIDMPEPGSAPVTEDETVVKNVHETKIQDVLAKIAKLGGQGKVYADEFKKRTDIPMTRKTLRIVNDVLTRYSKKLPSTKTAALHELDVFEEATYNYLPTLEEYAEAPHVSFENDDTLYEKTLTCLELLRSRN